MRDVFKNRLKSGASSLDSEGKRSPEQKTKSSQTLDQQLVNNLSTLRLLQNSLHDINSNPEDAATRFQSSNLSSRPRLRLIRRSELLQRLVEERHKGNGATCVGQAEILNPPPGSCNPGQEIY